MKATTKVVGYGVIVGLAQRTPNGRIIEEGTVSVTISSVVSGLDKVLLYEASNSDNP